MLEPGCAAKSGWLGKWSTSLCGGLGLAMMFVLASEPAVHSQSRPPSDIINRPAPMPTDPAAWGDYDPTMMERRQTALNIERQKELVSDTNKLLKLARELNDEVAANNTAALTQDQLHKIALIEKLARGVKQKMADGVGQQEPGMQTPFTIPAH
jgi:hypothetical protein